MSLLPRTLFGQLLVALLCGLLLVQVLGFWLLIDERVRFGERLWGAYAAHRIAGILSVLDGAEPAERLRLVRALDVPPTHLSLQEPWQPEPPQATPDAREFLAQVAGELARPLPLQLLSIKRGEARHRAGEHSGQALAPGSALANPEARHRDRRPVLFLAGQARLHDGVVVSFRHALPQQSLDWPLRLVGLLLVLGTSVALLAAWAVRRLTRPLAAMAEAAAGLALNLEQAPLPETGALEVARAARAFNAMQRDLRRYLHTRSQALAGVSHDLRLPLTRLRLRLERLQVPPLKAAMEADLQEMEDMISRTMDFLRAGTLAEPLVLLDLEALRDSLAEDMEILGATVVRHGRAGPLMAGPQALRRCLANLMDNARRYADAQMEVRLHDDGAVVEIRVEDRGPGIAPEQREAVFEPYVRLEASRARHTGGSGLGLAIARTIARAHGGDVRLESREGGGLSAVLALPRPQSSSRAGAGSCPLKRATNRTSSG